jgi:hypothetical protein
MAERTFDTGANRDVDDNKLDYEGFLSPLVLHRFAEYMHKKRKLSDGSQRASDNWQKGIPKEAYIKSGARHFLDWWLDWRDLEDLSVEELEDTLCGLMFNTMGFLMETLKEKRAGNDYYPNGVVRDKTRRVAGDVPVSPMADDAHGKLVMFPNSTHRLYPTD